MTDTKIYAGFCYCWEDCSHIVSSSQSQCICVCYDVNCLNLSAFVVDSVLDPQSRKMQARHYKALQELFKKPKPNKEDIAHLLDLEFESRRSFIECCSDKAERAKAVLEAYPCFSECQHVSDLFCWLSIVA